MFRVFVRAFLPVSVVLGCCAAPARAALRSPWDIRPVTPSSRPYSCPPIVSLSPDLTTNGFYPDGKSSIIDPALTALLRQATSLSYMYLGGLPPGVHHLA